MKLNILLLLFSSTLASVPSLDEIHKKSKRFWVDQFHPWEKTGITKDMIQGAKELYFDYWFAYDMATKNEKRNIRMEKNEIIMQLWTVIDGEIYLEENIQYEPCYIKGECAVSESLGFRNYRARNLKSFINLYHIDKTREYKSQIDYCLKTGKFPKKIQFWTHSQ